MGWTNGVKQTPIEPNEETDIFYQVPETTLVAAPAAAAPEVDNAPARASEN